MILFKEDWDLYPNAIVDTQTKNESFLHMAALYKEMGIENHQWMLQLHNPKLQGIDPHSKVLSAAAMLEIAQECKVNFFYYIREVVRVPGGMEDDPIKFRAHRGNMALYWVFFNHITFILEQIRQTGKSFACYVLDRWLTDFGGYKTKYNLLTKDDTLRSAALETLKEIRDELPLYLRMNRRDDSHNSEYYSINRLGNSFEAHVPQKSEKAALNVGRGLVSPVFRVDEAAFIYNIGTSLPAAFASGTAARDRAIRYNQPYGYILTTTSGKKDDRDGKYIFNMINNSTIMDERMFDCQNIKQLEEVVRKGNHKGELRISAKYNHRQLGYTDEWLRNAIEKAEATGEAADRDFGNIWTSGGQYSPLSIHLNEVIRNSERKDFFTEIVKPYNYVLRWFIPEHEIERRMASGFYTIGLDTSEAAGNDDIFMVVRDIRNGQVVCAGNFNETNLILFSQFTVDFLKRFENTLLVAERRSTGAMILDYLLLMLPTAGIDPFVRIYNRIVQDHEEFPDRFDEIRKGLSYRDPEVYVRYKKAFGFATSGSGLTSRSELYSTTLQQAAKTTGDRVFDPKLINQILGLVVRNGRVDHEPGEHDDGVIAWLLSFWILAAGKRLDFYGINSREILVNNAEHQKDNSPTAIYGRMEQQLLRNEIAKLLEQIKSERDDYLVSRYETKVFHLNNRLSSEDQRNLSIDDVVRRLKEERINRKKLTRR